MRNRFLIIILVWIFGCNGNNKSAHSTSRDSTITVVSGEPSCVPDMNSGSVNVLLIPQMTDMWCWAASGQMCMGYYGYNVSQCSQAKQEFGLQEDCCNSPITSECDKGGWPEFNKYGFSADVTDSTALSLDLIKRQISCLKKPVSFSWRWLGGGGHMMVIIGYKVVDGENYLLINDPLPVQIGSQYYITYDKYVAGLDHKHWNDYYNITKL